jgi:hypothetical protein
VHGDEGVDVGTDEARRRRPKATHLQDVRSRRRIRAASADEAPELGEDDAEWCQEHGSVRHLLVHEAGHAAAALDNNIVFACIVIYGEGRGPSGRPAQVKFACDDNSVWALPDPSGSLRFILAGEYAERAVLGDIYPGSGQGDSVTWHEAVGLTGTFTDERRDALLGRSADDVSGEASDWAESNVERIDRLAERLAELRLELPADQDCEFSYNEVVAFLAQA